MRPASFRSRLASSPSIEPAARAPSPTSTRVPTRFRTMCFRKAVASATTSTLPLPVGEDVEPPQLPDGVRRLAVGGPEGAEVVPPEQRRRCGPHGVDVEGPEDLPGLQPGERRAGGQVLDPVAVALAPRVAPGVEGRLPDLGRAHRHVLGEERVHPLHVGGRGQRALHGEARDLPERVHAGVGAPGAGDPHRLLVEGRERPLQLGLDRRPVGLDLPPHVAGAVVGEDELDPGHAPNVARARPCRVASLRGPVKAGGSA